MHEEHRINDDMIAPKIGLSWPLWLVAFFVLLVVSIPLAVGEGVVLVTRRLKSRKTR